MGKRMQESRQRIAARLSQAPLVRADAPKPEVSASVPLEPKKNCATCALYPCLLWRQRPNIEILAGPRAGQQFNFDRVAEMPMLCGGTYWEPRALSQWEQERAIRGQPSGLMQFKKDGR